MHMHIDSGGSRLLNVLTSDIGSWGECLGNERRVRLGSLDFGFGFRLGPAGVMDS